MRTLLLLLFTFALVIPGFSGGPSEEPTESRDLPMAVLDYQYDGFGPADSACSTACDYVTSAYNYVQSAINQLASNQCDVYASDAYSNLLTAKGNLLAAIDELCKNPGSCLEAQVIPNLQFVENVLDSAYSNVNNSSCLSSGLKYSLFVNIIRGKDSAHNGRFYAYDCCD